MQQDLACCGISDKSECFNAEPTYQRNITRVNKEGNVNWHLYNAGLNLGLFYKL